MDVVSLTRLVEELKNVTTNRQKLDLLSKYSAVEKFIEQTPLLQTFLQAASVEEQIVVRSILVIGQGEIVFQQTRNEIADLQKLRLLVVELLPVEAFYQEIGGIAGYHSTILRLMKDPEQSNSKKSFYTKPAGLDISEKTPIVSKVIRRGIESLEHLAEIYPVGGAGDRFQLSDNQTGEPLPIAHLCIFGNSLLRLLVRDLQAKEFLCYKLTGKHVCTPIAMMTSNEKNNHTHIQNICRQANWFGRPESSFRFFIQPLVPVVSEEGNWCLKAPLELISKPGGHGVMWKLAADAGIFSWLHGLGRTKALVRQINNPIAGVDHGLLAFTGCGLENNKAFGFSSCFRLLNTAEGMNVLVEHLSENQVSCAITNVEYTDFERKGIQDVAETPHSPYSAFPANTNLLFADLSVVESAIQKCPIPGMILNVKSRFECLNEEGEKETIRGGRLESTMQNIADVIVDEFTHLPTDSEKSDLKTFLTYNKRQKTISVTKKSWQEGSSITETPEGFLYDLQANAHELLVNECLMQLPPFPSQEEFVQQGLPFLFLYHPALGPTYEVIATKIRRGILHRGSILKIEASEVDIEKLDLAGSLTVIAEEPLGHKEKKGLLQYSEKSGKCVLKNVVVKNLGSGKKLDKGIWKHFPVPHESVDILIHGNGEFFAENVVFEGAHFIEVPDGCKVVAVQSKNGIELIQTKIRNPTWWWIYTFDEENQIKLTKYGE